MWVVENGAVMKPMKKIANKKERHAKSKLKAIM